MINMNEYFQNKQIRSLQGELNSLSSSMNRQAMEQGHNLYSKLDQLVLFNQAVAEILEERYGITTDDILNKMNEMDLRDGQKDGKYHRTPKTCPECDSKVNTRLNRCLFCGYQDKSPEGIL